MTPPMNFIAPKEESSYIKVIGVGGGGTNAVNHMYRQGITGVDFIACNTDSKSLSSSPVTTKIQLGPGLGAGNDPEVAKRYATENADTIKEALSDNTKMLFITAGMGGGTGTGASPIIAQIAKEIELDDQDVPKILVVAIVTMPFNFEGKARLEQAEAGVQELRKYVDSILIIDNNKVLGGEKLPFRKAFAKADDVLLTAAKSVAEIITVNAYMTIDFRDVNTVMKESGTALMGAGLADGDDRAMNAMRQAVTSPLLNDTDISDSQNLLLHFTCSEEYEITTEEIEETTQYLTSMCKNQPTMIWGIGYDESLGESVRIIVVATGFQKSTLNNPPQRQEVRLDSMLKSGRDFRVVQEERKEKIENFGETTFVQHPKEEQQPIDVKQPASTTTEPVKDTRVVHYLDDEPVTEEPVAEAPAMPQAETQTDTLFTVTSKNETAPFQEQQQPEPVAVQEIQHQPEAVAPQAQQEFAAPRPTVVESPADLEQRNATRDLVFSRMTNIKNLKEKYSTQAGFTEMEDVPSYARQGGIQASPAHDAAESEVDKTVVGKDGLLSPNSYVFTTVD